jgi:hypothetical protein
VAHQTTPPEPPTAQERSNNDEDEGDIIMTISIFNKKRVDKSNAFETEVLQRLESIQKSQATSRQDTRQIIREEIQNILNERYRKAWWQIT